MGNTPQPRHILGMVPTGSHQAVPPKRVLVVEDEVVAALSIQTLLAAEGHSVQIAEDAEEALEAFKAGEHDLVITDFKLGDMDGLQLAAAVKEHSPAKPVILITAYADKIAGTGKVSNVELVLKKPFSAAELQQAVSKVFEPA